jgi:hypothetical protein
MTDRPGGDPAAWGYEQAKEQVRAEAEIAAARRARPNGYDEDWRELPAIDQADVARWRGLEPPEIIFTIKELVPQSMVTLLTSVDGAERRC